MTKSGPATDSSVNYLSTLAFDEEFLDRVRAVSPRVHVQQVTADAVGDIPDDVWAGVDVLHTSSVLPTPAQAPRLKWVQLDTSGADHLRDQPIWTSDVPVTTLGGAGPVSMAEYVMFAVLGLSHRLPALIDARGAHTWPPPRRGAELFTPAPVRGTTMVILGYGRIGQEVARLAGAFGIAVIGVARSGVTGQAAVYDGRAVSGRPDAPTVRRVGPSEAVRPHPTEVVVISADRLDEALPAADFLVVVLPRTPETIGSIGRRQLGLLKPGVALVNASRGTIVDEGALLEYLRSGHVASAVLDVFDTEPLPADSPWWDEPGVFVTPHVGGLTPDYAAHVEQIVTGNLQRFLAGDGLLNVVDRQRGY